MSRYLIRISYVLMLLIWLLPAAGQSDMLTLEEAISYAFQNNPRLRQMEMRIRGAENLRGTVTGLVAPEISYFREGMSGDANSPFAEQRLSLKQSVTAPLSMGSRLKMASLEADLLRMEAEEFMKDLRANVKRSYIEVLYARYKLDLRKLQLKLVQNLLDAVTLRVESGMATGLDLLNAELQRAQAENELDAAQRYLYESRYTLFKTIGLPPEEQSYSILFADTLQILDEKIDQKAALEAIREYPRYRKAEIAVAQKKVLQKSIQRDLIPEIYVSYYRQDYGQGFHLTGVETGARIPLWYPIEQRSRIRIARAEEEELQYRETEIILELKEEIEHAWHSYDEYGKMVQRFKETIDLRSERLQTLTLEAYRVGEIDLLNLLNAQSIYLNTREQYLEALHDYYIQAAMLEKFLPEEIVF